MDSDKPPALPPMTSNKKNPRYPSKTCKYAGVTFRASRDKYQARIYKGNKEYNLGLFDISADAALAYDMAHRLMKKVSAAQGKEKEMFESFLSDKNARDWFDYGNDADANNGLDTDKLNFLRPDDFKRERQREIKESQLAGMAKHGNCPKLEELRVIVRKESIRVTKIIVGAGDGGTNNYRRKGKKDKTVASQDGPLENPKKKKKKSSGSASSGKGKKKDSVNTSEPAAKDPFVASATVPKGEALQRATELAKPVHKPSRKKKKDAPSGSPPVDAVGPMARINPQMKNQMGENTLKTVMEDSPQVAAVNRVKNHMNKTSCDDKRQHDNSDGDNDVTNSEEREAARKNNNHAIETTNWSPFSQDNLQAGNISGKHSGGDYHKMMGMPASYCGMAGATNNNEIPGGMNRRMSGGPSTSENYHEFFKNMRNPMFHPGIMGGGAVGAMAQNNMMYDAASQEDFQRMMFARAMGQNPGIYNAGMTSMMVMNTHPSLNRGSLQNEGIEDQQNDSMMQQRESLKTMAQGGMERFTPNDIHQGQFSNHNLQSRSPTTLNMLRVGGFSNAQMNPNHYGAAAAQQVCLEGSMYGGDPRFGQHLHGAFHGSQYVFNPSSYGPQQSFLNPYGASTNFPSSASVSGNSHVSGGGGGGDRVNNPAFDDISHMLGMSGSSHPPPKNQGNNA